MKFLLPLCSWGKVSGILVRPSQILFPLAAILKHNITK
ncbi:hypothetical protein AB406_0094 [Riemerella anatipestifer]|uniref:Uncharacterized protein n=1 Tax=Riemerella anatipestifer TaxID=34085 RepID=A0A1S7DPL2_RIEAN|nr:hypothetical protein AB406_0094 [Riemerella anatipestifer]